MTNTDLGESGSHIGYEAAWANVHAWSHTSVAKQVGYMFDAVNTDMWWDWSVGWFGWWAIDVMGTGTPAWTRSFSYLYKSHEWTHNKNAIRNHIDRIVP